MAMDRRTVWGISWVSSVPLIFDDFMKQMEQSFTRWMRKHRYPRRFSNASQNAFILYGCLEGDLDHDPKRFTYKLVIFLSDRVSGPITEDHILEMVGTTAEISKAKGSCHPVSSEFRYSGTPCIKQISVDLSGEGCIQVVREFIWVVFQRGSGCSFRRFNEDTWRISEWLVKHWGLSEHVANRCLGILSEEEIVIMLPESCTELAPAIAKMQMGGRPTRFRDYFQ